MKKTVLALSVFAALATQHALAGSFFTDSSATLVLRNFYLDHDNRESGNYAGQAQEWGQGFIGEFRSGFTEGTVGVGLDALGLLGVRLDGGGRTGKAGQERTPGQLFPQRTSGRSVRDYASLGLTTKLRLAKTEVRHGTLRPSLPVLVHNDGRLLPQTFTGTHLVSNDLKNLQLHAGLIEQVRGRASTDRTGLAVLGGSRESNHFWFAGADWQALPQVKAQYYFAKLEDYYNQHFLGLTHDWKLGDQQALKTDIRYFNTSSTGANSTASGRAKGYRVSGYSHNNSGEIDNTTWSLAFTYSHAAHALTLGHQRVSDNSGFTQPHQGGLDGSKGAGGNSIYLHTNRLIEHFVRAGENTSFASYGYDFKDLGLPGLKASTTYLRGSNIKSVQGRLKEWERDVRVDYRFQSGPLKNVTLTWLNASVRSQVSNDQDHNRIIVSYNIQLI